LADYKALQAALEEQAKAEAELAAEAADAESNEAAETQEVTADESAATSEVAEHDQAESDSGDAAAQPPKRFRWLTRKKRH
jgi:outer membrane lipoprotein-sorting protein